MSKKAMLTVNKQGNYTVWIIPFNFSKGADYVEGDCSYINFNNKQEAFAYLRGYADGREIQ